MKREEKRTDERKGSNIRSLRKGRIIKKTEPRAKEIAKKYQIEGLKMMKNNRIRTDQIVM